MFFNPLASANPNYKVLASAQMTITDQTDASNLAGNMTIVTGSKSQVYMTGATQPYSPDWKINKLVLRPYMIATNVYRGPQSERYNPDLFDPWEYPDLTKPGDINVTKGYIYDIEWYLVDTAGNQKLIDVNAPESVGKFSHTWEYSKKDESVLIQDKRQLVISDNILEKDAVKSILIKYTFLDPFADIRVPVSYNVELNCLSTGVGSSKANINSIDGNSFYNEDPNTLRFIGEYYSEGSYINLQEKLESPTDNSTAQWFIRTQTGWSLLDPVTQDDNQWNQPGKPLYEIHRIVSYNENTNTYVTEKTKNPKGGVVLVVNSGLIAGSDIIKLSITDSQLSDSNYSALETIYDHSDPTQCYVHSSNGDKLYKGMETPGTTLKAVVTYMGNLLSDGAPEYGESGSGDSTRIFDYYWYRIDSTGNIIENVYKVGEELRFKNTSDADYNSDNGWPKSLSRKLDIRPDQIDKKATFSLDLLNKKANTLRYYRENLKRSLATEDDVRTASIMIQEAGLNRYEHTEILNTAIELRAFTIAQEENIIEAFKARKAKKQNESK